ncbi:putative ABC transporter permease, partial [Candidatus Saccharibacteria bacterium]|nr:putative ABC transporter permease [Candidatus Saccharibacteria bacterium]
MLFTYLVVVFSFLSVFGWVWETIVFSLQEKHFVRRGFLAGPYCPIYGVGALMILALAIWIHQLVYLVIAAMVVATLLEYSTSVLLEKWFKLKLWDYKREKYNYQGRICLKTTIIWGFFALLFVYVLNP